MNRHEKEQLIASLRDSFSSSAGSLLVCYRGLSVAQIQELRSNLRKQKAVLKVAKVRLAKLALEGLEGVEGIAPFFEDQVGIVFVREEAAPVAKALVEFRKKFEQFTILGGYAYESILDGKRIEDIAALPLREVLAAQLCGVLNAPAAALVRTLNGATMRLLCVLKKAAEKKAGSA